MCLYVWLNAYVFQARKIRELPMYLQWFFFGEHQDCRHRHGDKSEHKGKRGKRNHKKHSRSSDVSGSDEEDEHCKEKKRRKAHSKCYTVNIFLSMLNFSL